nr:unnamed protein product [Callosobruchus analis]
MKILPLIVLLAEEKPSIFLVTEHGLKKDGLTQVHLDEYKLINYWSRLEWKLGGTAIFAQEAINIVSLGTKTKPVEMYCEFTVAELNLNRKYMLICMYRSPSGDFEIFASILTEILDELYTVDSYLIIGGDFNVNFALRDPSAITLINIMMSYALEPLGYGMTRVTATSRTQIDNIFSNICNNEISFSPCITDISDHYGQIIKLNITKNLQSYYTRRRFFSHSNIQHLGLPHKESLGRRF